MTLWEILVPTVRNNGTPIKLRFHRIWDEKVRAITGGLTIINPIKGQWIAPSGKLFSERMIPVRVACSKDQIGLIADLTAAYYEQEAVMFYKVSEEVEIRYYEMPPKPKKKHERCYRTPKETKTTSMCPPIQEGKSDSSKDSEEKSF